MRLAYISYEYPPDTALGGIGTYVYMVSRAMKRMGHEVEVFCASKSRESLNEVFEEGVIVHRVKCRNRKKFPTRIAPVFARRHALMSFDLAESPEFDADGRVIRTRFPELHLAVKFHTPKFLVEELNNSVSKKNWWTFLQEKFKRKYSKDKDLEYQLTMAADDLSSPSLSLKTIVAKRWKIPADRIRHHPYIFLPDPAFLQIPADTNTKRITFIGRLEIRKGVLTLAQVIPIVLKLYPDAHFRFVGRPGRTQDGRHMDTYLKEELVAFSPQVEFISAVSMEKIPHLLAETDICVFPSLWENFPNVCLEAMSAGRGIVASDKGGMKDMLQDINGGILIDPHNPREIADGICHLLKFPDERIAMGKRCRQKILDYYSGSLLEETSLVYENNIKKRTGDKPPVPQA